MDDVLDFPVLRQVHELKLVTSVLPVLNTNLGLRAQWYHRPHHPADRGYYRPLVRLQMTVFRYLE